MIKINTIYGLHRDFEPDLLRFLAGYIFTPGGMRLGPFHGEIEQQNNLMEGYKHICNLLRNSKFVELISATVTKKFVTDRQRPNYIPLLLALNNNEYLVAFSTCHY